MIKEREVRSEGCICEPCSDILPNWNDMRSEFGYRLLGETVAFNTKPEYI